MAQVLRELKNQYGDRMIHLDGGDLFQGSLEGNMSKGRSIVDFYNLLTIDAAAIGNHELDYGPDVPGRVIAKGREDALGALKARVRQAKFKWLSANWIKARAGRCTPRTDASITHCNALGQRTVFEPHAVFRKDGAKVCVIGATTPTTPHITRPEYVKRTAFEELNKVVRAEAEFLRKKVGCELVLLTAHAGLLCAPDGSCTQEGDRAEMLRLLRKLPAGTVDAVVAGHTHMAAQEVVNGTPVLEAGSHGQKVGLMILFGSAGKRNARFEPFIDVPENATQPDITATLKPYRDAAAGLKARPAGIALTPFPRNYNAETALGNMIADSLRLAGKEVADADFALMNAGGVRTGLPQGALTYNDLFQVLPFENSLAVVDLRGSELRRILEVALSGGHGLPPVSGLRIKRIGADTGQRGPWDRDLNKDGKTEDWERDLLLEVTDESGRPLEDSKRYKLATVDFLTGGGDHQKENFDKIPDARKRVFQDIWGRDVVADFLKKRSAVRADQFYDPAHPRIQNTAPNK